MTIGAIIPSDGNLEDECYSNLAKKFNDPTWCQNVYSEVGCLAGIAVFEKNPNLCFTFGLGDRDIQSCVDSIAYWDAAGKKLCNKLTKKESREYCTSESSRYHFIKGGFEYK